MWKLIVEHGEEDFRDGVLDAFLEKTPAEVKGEESTCILTYLYPDKPSVVTAKRKLKLRYRAKVHVEIVPV